MHKENFLTTLIDTLKEHSMLKSGDRVLVAVSGGADSMALLYGLMETQKKHGAFLAVAHLDHSLRAESEAEADFVKEEAEKLGLEFYKKKVDLKKEYKNQNLEEAGRIARYDFFENICLKNNYNKIATAHNADDNAEQLLMNLIRGCGPEGLEGIAEKRGRIIRPIIRVPRLEIISYLKKRGLSWKEDLSNQDTSFLRNRIRHKLLPILEEEYNPAIRKNLLTTARIIKDENLWFDRGIEENFKKLLISEEEGRICLNARKLASCPRAFQARFFRYSVRRIKENTHGLNYSHIEKILKLLQQREAKEYHLPDKLLVRLYSGILEIKKTRYTPRERKNEDKNFQLKLELPLKDKEELELPHDSGLIRIQKTPFKEDIKTKQAFPSELFPLTIRPPCSGDRIRSRGKEGSSRIFKLFAKAGIPAHLRKKHPVFIFKDQIIWIPGLIADEKFFSDNFSKEYFWLSWTPKYK